jgi:hypothetical protein
VFAQVVLDCIDEWDGRVLRDRKGSYRRVIQVDNKWISLYTPMDNVEIHRNNGYNHLSRAPWGATVYRFLSDINFFAPLSAFWINITPATPEDRHQRVVTLLTALGKERTQLHERISFMKEHTSFIAITTHPLKQPWSPAWGPVAIILVVKGDFILQEIQEVKPGDVLTVLMDEGEKLGDLLKPVGELQKPTHKSHNLLLIMGVREPGAPGGVWVDVSERAVLVRSTTAPLNLFRGLEHVRPSKPIIPTTFNGTFGQIPADYGVFNPDQ